MLSFFFLLVATKECVSRVMWLLSDSRQRWSLDIVVGCQIVSPIFLEHPLVARQGDVGDDQPSRYISLILVAFSLPFL